MKPHYEGEDLRPTSVKELWGWYAYGFAAEVFVVCGVGKNVLTCVDHCHGLVGLYARCSHCHADQRSGSFIPITLEQLARERGVLLADRSTPCDAEIITAADTSGQCIVTMFGVEINTASFAMYTFSISVFLQALLIISMSGAADHGSHRKALLLMFGFVGAGAVMLFLLISADTYMLGALFAIVANTCFGASSVLLNSFLPLLVRQHPEAQGSGPAPETTAISPLDEQDEDVVHAEVLTSSTAGLLSNDDHTKLQENAPPGAAQKSIAQLSSRISANGIGVGYIAAFVVQVLGMGIVTMLGETLWSLKVVLFLIGAWWFAFSVPSALWLRPRPGPPLQIGSAGLGRRRVWLAYISHSWKSLGKTAVRARQLKDVLLFLAAWFLLSDAMATISGTAVLFAKTTLHMKPKALALINVVVMLSGVTGAFAWRTVERILHISPLQTILACLALFALIPFYALLGFIEGFPLGLKNPWEMYPVALTYGLILGGLSSYCRSTFSLLIPPGSEAAFYALYAITDKGSSVLGPAVVGAITDRFGEIRPAFTFLAVLVLLPGFILMWVNVERGRAEGAKLAQVVGGGARLIDEADEEVH